MSEVLQQIMQSYFHQDWTSEFSPLDEAVLCIVQNNPATLLDDFAAELHSLLRRCEMNANIGLELESLSLGYIPENAKDWIVQILALLEQDQKTRRRENVPGAIPMDRTKRSSETR